MTAGQILREGLSANSTTQKQLAKACGLSPQYINDILRDRRSPAPETAAKILFGAGLDAGACRRCIDHWQRHWVELRQKYERATEEAVSETAYYNAFDALLRKGFAGITDELRAILDKGADPATVRPDGIINPLNGGWLVEFAPGQEEALLRRVLAEPDREWHWSMVHAAKRFAETGRLPHE
jgi:transcriptional regulator with XRE-family HTH domain